MADESYFQQMLNALKGTSAAPSLDTSVAPPLPAYPSHADADYARNYGFGDNNIQEDYLNNNKARILGGTISFADVSPKKGATKVVAKEMFVPMSGDGQYPEALTSTVNDPKGSTVLDLNNSRNSDIGGDVRNLHMRAALAANRSPIAAVGFDPSRVVLDSLIGGGPKTYTGAYYSPPDGIYSAIEPRDAVVHESTHRGLEKLREQYPSATNKIFKDLPSEETIVRWLMHTTAGDPELGGGNVADQQRQRAIDYFTNGMMKKPAEAALNQLQELAIETMKGRGKRAGPQ